MQKKDKGYILKLQSHQERAKLKIDKNKRQLLYHGLGSGKTLTSLVSREGKTVVVTPASLRTNISDTISKFKLPKDGVSVYSYEGATKDKPIGDTLIVDEAHRLGDSTSKRSKALVGMSKKFKKVILLTGSPIRNRPSEISPLASMLGISDREVPLSEKSFNNKFIEIRTEPRTVSEYFRGIKPGTTRHIKNKKALSEIFNSKVDYFAPSKENYPDTNEVTHSVPMSKSQYGLYKNLVDNTDSDVVYKVGNDKPMTASEKAKANTFLSAARILSNSEVPFGGKNITPKVKNIVDNIESKKNEKHLVYSAFLDGGINTVSDAMKKRNINHNIFNGSMNDGEKRLAVNNFNNSDSGVLLISGAGAEGLDLKGVRHIHIMEPHWNKARVNQVIGRGVRFKSHDHLPKNQRNVTIHHYNSVLPQSSVSFLSKVVGKTKPKMGADQYLLNLSNRKESLNKDFLNAITQ